MYNIPRTNNNCNTTVNSSTYTKKLSSTMSSCGPCNSVDNSECCSINAAAIEMNAIVIQDISSELNIIDASINYLIKAVDFSGIIALINDVSENVYDNSRVIIELNNELDDLSGVVQDLSSNVYDLSGEIFYMPGVVRDLSNVVLDLSGDHYTLKSGFNDLSNVVLDLSGDHYTLKYGFNDLSNVVLDLSGDHYTLKTAFNDLSNVVLDLSGDHYTLKTAFNDLSNVVLDLSGDHYTLKSSFNDLSNVVLDLSNVVLDLSGDHYTLKSGFNDLSNVVLDLSGKVVNNTTAITTKVSKSGDTMTGDLTFDQSSNYYNLRISTNQYGTNLQVADPNSSSYSEKIRIGNNFINTYNAIYSKSNIIFDNQSGIVLNNATAPSNKTNKLYRSGSDIYWDNNKLSVWDVSGSSLVLDSDYNEIIIPGSTTSFGVDKVNKEAIFFTDLSNIKMNIQGNNALTLTDTGVDLSGVVNFSDNLTAEKGLILSNHVPTQTASTIYTNNGSDLFFGSNKIGIDSDITTNATAITTKVSKSGDTMTGDLSFTGNKGILLDPTSSNYRAKIHTDINGIHFYSNNGSGGSSYNNTLRIGDTFINAYKPIFSVSDIIFNNQNGIVLNNATAPTNKTNKLYRSGNDIYWDNKKLGFDSSIIDVTNIVDDLSNVVLDLSGDHNTLNTTFIDLSTNFLDLSGNHNTLNTAFIDLSNVVLDLSGNHNTLNTAFIDLSTNHNTLNTAFNNLNTNTSNNSIDSIDLTYDGKVKNYDLKFTMQSNTDQNSTISGNFLINDVPFPIENPSQTLEYYFNPPFYDPTNDTQINDISGWIINGVATNLLNERKIDLTKPLLITNINPSTNAPSNTYSVKGKSLGSTTYDSTFFSGSVLTFRYKQDSGLYNTIDRNFSKLDTSFIDLSNIVTANTNSISTKVSKTGDTITGNLDISGANLHVQNSSGQITIGNTAGTGGTMILGSYGGTGIINYRGSDIFKFISSPTDIQVNNHNLLVNGSKVIRIGSPFATTAYAPLQINGAGNSLTYLHDHGTLTFNGVGTGSYVTQYNASILTSHDILTFQTVRAVSDRRIKTNIVDASNSLEVMRKIPLRNYEYIDKIQKGTNDSVKGWIAQEVRTHLPQAVRLKSDYIPNVMLVGEITNNILTTSEPFDVSNTNVKIIDPSDNNYFINLDNKLNVSSGSKYQISFIGENYQGPCFVYGENVDDFHVIDKAYMTTLLYGAVSELDENLTSEVNRLTLKTNGYETEKNILVNKVYNLEQDNENLKAENALLKQQILSIEQRLSAIEASASGSGSS